MKNKLPILTVAWLGSCGLCAISAYAQAPAQVSQPVVAPASAGETLVHQAVERLEQYSSLRAKVRYRADLFDERIIGNGEYRQGASASHLLRCDLKMQIGEQIISIQQVADGNFLWTNKVESKGNFLSRIDMNRVLAAERSLPRPSGSMVPPHGLGLAGIGGLPKLLRNLDGAFCFGVPSPSQLGKLPVHIVRGSWEPIALAQVMPEQKAAITAGQGAEWKKVPAHVPDQVMLVLGRDDLFPYRIEYQRAESGTSKSLMVIELYEVRCNIPLERTVFAYQPGASPISDQTDNYISKLTATP